MGLAILEILGALTRYLLYKFYYKIFGNNETKNFEYFTGHKNRNIFEDINSGFYNILVGFLTFFFLLYSLYLLTKYIFD